MPEQETQTQEKTQETTPPETQETQTQETQTQETQTQETQTTETQETQSPAETITQQEAQPPESTAEEEAPPERVVPAADGYKLPEGAPPELGEFAHSNDMTQEQLDNTLKAFTTYIEQDKAVRAKALRDLGEAHVKNWGANAKYNLSLAKRALAQNDPDGTLAKALNESGYGNHPAVLDFLFRLGTGMKEGGFLKSEVNRPPGKKTTAQKMFPDMPSAEA